MNKKDFALILKYKTCKYVMFRLNKITTWLPFVYKVIKRIIAYIIYIECKGSKFYQNVIGKIASDHSFECIYIGWTIYWKHIEKKLWLKWNIKFVTTLGFDCNPRSDRSIFVVF